jgi:hypothetical protein
MTLNESYIDPPLAGQIGSLYQDVNARSCRTCHVAIPSN